MSIHRTMVLCAGLGALLSGSLAAAAEELPAVSTQDYASLPANTWTLVHVEDASGGKTFARVVYSPKVDRLYLWGFGGATPQRNRYLRYELESLAPGERKWVEALPTSKADAWANGKHPPFVIWGRNGPAKGPKLRSVGNQSCNRVAFHEFDGVARPSPVAIFNQVCYDSKRDRLVFFAGGHTFALDPATQTWTDLKPAKSPVACQQLAWGNLVYDPVNDEVLLFGGGDALNLAGGASTWLYDCGKNTWYRPTLEVQPPLRCTSPIVYDPASKMLVMFGGYDLRAALNDTWVYHCKERRWEQRKPDPSPPPMFAPAVAVVPGGGRVLVGQYNALTGKWTHSATRAPKETWVYDVAADKWTPVGERPNLLRYGWLTAAGSEKHGVVFLVAFGRQRRTYAFRYDPATKTAKRDGAPPGTVAWKRPRQKLSLEAAPEPDPKAQGKLLADLPANQFVNAKPPGLLFSKTWSTAIMNTDTGEVIYHGGGHSGYSGNDWAHYSVATNRWTLAYPPCFPPYLEASNGSPWGYSYRCRPWSQHTYLWYAYDPTSKMVIYCARPTIHTGVELALDAADPDKSFLYDVKKHGYWTWLYDPAKKEMHGPSFGRPFANPWHLALCTTPKGVYAMASGVLYRAAVADGKVTWTALDTAGPTGKAGYNYEWQPIVYDSKRDRLIHLMGRPPGSRSKLPATFEMHARGLGKADKWEPIKWTGVMPAPIREVVYLPRQDALIGLVRQDKLYAFHCETNQWRHLDVKLPKGSYGTECAMEYDPVHDVAVALVPSGFSAPMQVLLFRYDPETAKDRPTTKATADSP